MERQPKKIIISEAVYNSLVSQEKKKSENIDTDKIISEIKNIFETYQFPLHNNQENIKEDETPEIKHSEGSVDQPLYDTAKVSDIVSQIRKLSLQGINLLADAVDAPEYDIFKRIWTICEKQCLSSKKQEN